MTLALVYLARGTDGGLASCKGFFSAYNQYSAECDHDLIVIAKGWENEAERSELQGLAIKNKAKIVDLPDDGLDWGAYMRLAPQLDHEWICFLNTHSRPKVSGWLNLLKSVADSSPNNFGAVGATGSWESPLPKIFSTSSNYKRIQGAFIYPFRMIVNSCRYIANVCESNRFPNPHIRSNAFLVRRQLFIEYCLTQSLPRSKRDTAALENGRNGFSAYLLSRTLQLYVAGADGKAYKISNWPKSNTFRVGRQENLIISDNQTIAYEIAENDFRKKLTILAWGAMHK